MVRWSIGITKAQGKKKPAKRRVRKNAPNIALLLLIAVVVVFSAFLVFLQLSNISLAKVSVAGVNVGRTKAKSDAATKLATAVEKYRFSIVYADGNTKVFELNQAGLAADIPATLATLNSAQEKQSFWKRWQFWSTINLDLVFKTDEAQLHKFISTEATVLKKPYSDASIAINNGQVSIIQSANGNGYTIPGGKISLINRLSQLDSKPIALTFQPIPPAIRSASLLPIKQQADKIIAGTFVFVIYGQEIKASPQDISQWLTVSMDPAKQTAVLNFDSNRIMSYVGQITRPYAYSARSQVVFSLSDGTKVALSPSYGELNGANKAAVATDLAKQISTGNLRSELAINYTSGTNLNYAYDKWLAVDLTAKRMYAYEKTALVRTFLISAGAPSTPTTPGFHRIYSKVRRQDMRGPNADGTSYFQANVEYVNYFKGGEAIHGNYWRPLYYFGSINSSHGCVGIVNGDAAWVYNWAPIGTPVIAYN